MSFILRKLSAFLSIFYINRMGNIYKSERKIHKLIKKEIFRKNNKNLKATHVDFNFELYELIKNGSLYNFLRKSFIQKMFFVHNRLFIFKELRYLKKQKNWKFYEKLLIEDNVGDPIRYFLYPKSSGNRINHVYHLSLLNKHLNLDLKKIEYVFEFGGGYGCMARIISKINRHIKYVIYDTKLVNYLQYYYLKENKLKVGFQKNNSISLINNFNNIKLRKLKSGSVFIANWSLSEVPINLRNKFLGIINSHNYILISFQEHFEDINNLFYFKDLKKKLSKRYNISIIKNKYYTGNIFNQHNHYFLLGKKKS